ncbi:unnamed protein product [Caenorhabditis bovis]|uniref:Uncharacterized protein n=1 Tax=Caenorhabditis bovis TaxID=2654633 RepID=A0A8S1FF48_9PELO|nr:unnamed protein product [Caenorhabditis bovis]
MKNYEFSLEELQDILDNFVKKIESNWLSYNFYWVKSMCYGRMVNQAFMLFDDISVPYVNVNSVIISAFFRAILPIISTFVVGCGASAIHSIIQIPLDRIFKVHTYPPMSIQRNKACKMRDFVAFCCSLVYFLFSFFTGCYVLGKWQNSSFIQGMKLACKLIASITPDVPAVTQTLTVLTFAASALHIYTGICYVLFTAMRLFNSVTIARFDIPQMDNIADAHITDKTVLSKHYDRYLKAIHNVQ